MNINTKNNDLTSDKFKIFVVTTGIIQDISLPIAASKAGAFGILNLEYGADIPKALNSIEKIAKISSTSFGIKISAFD